MADNVADLNNVTNQLNDASSQAVDAVDSVSSNINNLSDVLQTLVNQFEDVDDAAENQQDVINKVKDALSKHEQELTNHTDSLEDSSDEQEKYNQQIDQTRSTLESFTQQAEDSGTAIQTLATISSNISADTSASISSAAEAISESISRDNDETRPFLMEESQFQEWLDSADGGMELSSFQRFQENNARLLTEAMSDFKIGDSLAAGITVAVPEFAPIVEFFKNSKMVKALTFGMFNWLRRRKQRKIQDRLQRAQLRLAQNPDNPEDVHRELARENSNIFTRSLNSLQSNLSGILLGSNWRDAQQEAFTNAMSGFTLDESTVQGLIREGTQVRNDQTIAATLRHFGGGLEGTEEAIRENNMEMADLFTQMTTATDSGDREAAEELYNELEEQNTILQRVVDGNDSLTGFIESIENQISNIDNDEEISKLQELRQTIIDQNLQGDRLNSLNDLAGDGLTIDTDGEKLAKQLGLRGSPPYLETLVNYFTKTTWIDDLKTLSGTDSLSPQQNNQPDIPDAGGKLDKVGKGILNGISSFVDGLTAIVNSSFQFFQSFINGISNVISKVEKVISKTFIQLMTGLGRGISALFTALGSIPLPALAIGAAALGALSLSLMGMGLALKLAAPFVKSVLSGLTSILGALGKIIKVVADSIVNFITSLTDNLIKLTQIPFGDFVKLGAAFVILGASLGIFGLTAGVAVAPLMALGAASAGLASLMEVLSPDQMVNMAKSFRVLAGAVKDFGLSSLALIPAVGLLTALSAIPFANKLVDLQLKNKKVDQSGSPEVFTADTLQIGSIRSIAGEALMTGNERMNQLNAETRMGSGGESVGNIVTTTAVTTNNEATIVQPKTAVDRGFMDSLISVQQLTV